MSEFWKRKLRTYFNVLDVNKNGFFSRKDVEAMADSLSNAENCSPEQRAEIKENFVTLWQNFMKSAGSDDNELLTPSILVASVDQLRDDPEFQETYVKICHHYFRTGDSNGDGLLSETEYARLYAKMGVQDTTFLRSAFECVDLNQDGKLDLYEFSSALLKYLTTEDERLLWGPLV